ncbi:M23 family metallopeptidase [Methylocapsa sp. D3K7]|uniref:M23 family metallopeptidase n=1 Tax=Methylocapsa sp. D3K7 TaxID=3041435 RepID=UPI00244EE374|nr:M23 family metallopeptidase [Methylocapsa sp. D3K7]WGJ13922.1 M23 family metallopeptidase [Methylocapsa sp. D3K7]
MTMSAQLGPQSHGFRLRPSRFGAIDFGIDPAIETSGARQASFDRRKVSLRWFAGTLLTGVSGGALIAAAIYAALGHQTYFAEPTAPALSQRKEITLDYGVNSRKGDRLVKAVDIIAEKQSFQAPAAIQSGDKEVMKVHTFTHVQTTLTLASFGLSDDVPQFNPLKVLAGARNALDAAPEPVQDDAEISWSTRELAGQKFSLAAALSMEEVQAQIAEQVKNTMAAGARPLPLPPQLLLMRTSRAYLPNVLAYANPGEPISTAPFSTIEVRMVPENVSNIGRTPRVSEATQMEERLVVIRHGETLESVLRSAGVTNDQIKGIIAAFGTPSGRAVVAEGARLKLLFADLDGSGTTMTLARLSVYSGETLETNIAVNDRGEYVPVTLPRRTAKRQNSGESDDSDDTDGMRLYDSLYETAMKQEIPRPVTDELVRIFANDVDFGRAVSGGDSFEAFYDESEEGEGHNQLLYATITARNETYRYYRFQTPDDGVIDYYDQDGRSTRKFLVRMPIVGGRFTSGFGIRYHPILGYSRPHTGVDWAAPIGTPIFAAGSGTIIKAGWDSGYGRRVEIQHANGYITTYNHMSGFARGATEGAHVRQGQPIGYLGQTGLATGPHLHYEIMVNGHFVDPMRVKLARTREFDGRMLANFKRERERIDSLVLKAPNADRIAARQDH